MLRITLFLFYRSLFVWWPILSVVTEQESNKIMGGYLQSSTNFLGKIDEIHPILAYFPPPHFSVGSVLDGARQFTCFFIIEAFNIELRGG